MQTAENFITDSIEELLKKKHYSYGCLSWKVDLGHKKIVLIDKMGQLRKCLQIATLAIIGGSFVPGVGGHNIMEPLWYGIPVLFGPFMHKQKQFVQYVLHSKAGRQVEVGELQNHVHELLNNQFKREQMGSRGRRIFSEASGGSQKTLEEIKTLLK